MLYNPGIWESLRSMAATANVSKALKGTMEFSADGPCMLRFFPHWDLSSYTFGAMRWSAESKVVRRQRVPSNLRSPYQVGPLGQGRPQVSWNCLLTTLAVSHCGTVADLKVAAQQWGNAEACCTWRAPFGVDWINPLVRTSRWRKHCCCSTAAKGSCNWPCVCFVVFEVTEFSRGAFHPVVVTAPESKISWGMSSRFAAQAQILPQF